jgi:FkbM family methyltransferase
VKDNSFYSKVVLLLKAFATVLNPHHWASFAHASRTTNFDHNFRVSWSQGGEDLALLSIFENMDPGRYVDVGAHHPSRFSVTRHLYQLGWRGVNIDADRELIAEFAKIRNDEVNLFVAVGNEPSYEFAIFEEPAISTTNSEWRNEALAKGRTIARTEIIQGRTLSSILGEYFPREAPDLLTIDIEGADYDALTSIDFKKQPIEKYPKWILLETKPPVTEALNFPAVKYAISFGYETYLVLPMATLLKAPKTKVVKKVGEE